MKRKRSHLCAPADGSARRLWRVVRVSVHPITALVLGIQSPCRNVNAFFFNARPLASPRLHSGLRWYTECAERPVSDVSSSTASHASELPSYQERLLPLHGETLASASPAGAPSTSPPTAEASLAVLLRKNMSTLLLEAFATLSSGYSAARPTSILAPAQTTSTSTPRAPSTVRRATTTSRTTLATAQGSGVSLHERIKAATDGSEREGRDGIVLYFAYGANMSPSVMTGKRGIKPIASEPVKALAIMDDSRLGKARLPVRDADSGTSLGDEGGMPFGGEDGEGICLSFCHRAGYATLVSTPGPPQSWRPSPGVHGVIHAVTPSDVNRIATFEGGYDKCKVEVEGYTGARYCAVCFISHPMQILPASVPPTSRYLSLLQEGASYYGVNEDYVSWLAQIPSVQCKDETLPERMRTPTKILTDRVLACCAFAIAVGAARVLLFTR